MTGYSSEEMFSYSEDELPVEKTTYAQMLAGVRSGVFKKYVVQTSDSSDSEDEHRPCARRKLPSKSHDSLAGGNKTPMTADKRQLSSTSCSLAGGDESPTTDARSQLPSKSRGLAGGDKTPTTNARRQLPSKSRSLAGGDKTPTTDARRQLPSKSRGLAGGDESPTTDARSQLPSTSRSLAGGDKTPTTDARRQLPSKSRSLAGGDKTPTTDARRQLPSKSRGLAGGDKTPTTDARRQLPSTSHSLDGEKTPTTKGMEKGKERAIGDAYEDEDHGMQQGIQVFQELRNTNLLLGKLINQLRNTERRVEALEERGSSSVSSSSSGSSEHKSRRNKDIPLHVRSETRKMYKTLLDEEENFVGYDTSQKTTFKDTYNQDVSKRLINEVKSLNPSFLAADIRAASYTYYKTLCQEASLERRGKIADRKTQRRRKQRALTKLSKRRATFEMLSFEKKERWRKVMIPEMMSSDESGKDDEGRAVIFVKDLPWRSDKVGRFFERLDFVQYQSKSEQAVRQSKLRVFVTEASEHLPPSHLSTIPQWAYRSSVSEEQSQAGNR